MKPVPPVLAAHLAGEATTLARCWILTRPDGVTLGFTDHDRDIVVAGVPCRASTGLDAAEATAELGFAVGGGEVVGALADAGLSEVDLAAGRYDGAEVETWLVNWAAPAERLKLDVAVVGEVKRSDAGFTAELRSLAHRYDEERGRLYTRGCGADLGDARCGLPIAPAADVVVETDGRLALRSAALGGAPDGSFTAGRLAFTSGPNAGFVTEVKLHRASGGGAEFTLWQIPPHAIAPGDAFTVTPGCDKRFATCRDRFGNQTNFRGFPHMPGNDVILRVARQGEAGMDGGSLFQ